MKQCSLKKWLKTERVETKVETASSRETGQEGTDQRISPDTVELTLKNKGFQKAKEAWSYVGIASYNVETLGNNRIQTLCHAMGKEGVKIMMLQGTRYRYDGDGQMGEYKIFYGGCGDTATQDNVAGTAIIIHSSLIKGARVTKMNWMTHRILAIRIKSVFLDVTLVTAYAYTESTVQKKKKEFWEKINSEMRRLPKRTNRILGIDANGHVGRDPGPGLGTKGMEMWTFNGLQLQDLVTESSMTALNTMDTCANAGPTWFRRDQKGQGRIDYLVVDTKMLSWVRDNHGATEWDEIARQGTPIDHKSVTCWVDFRLLQEKRQTKKRNPMMKGMSTYNNTLTQKYEQYIKIVDNRYRSEENNWR